LNNWWLRFETSVLTSVWEIQSFRWALSFT